MTNCLNFASPEDPSQYWVLNECIRGLADSCKELDCPVVSGNVSLYNETVMGGILPTPLVGITGLIENEDYMLPSGRWQEGDLLVYAGIPNPSVAGSYYQQQILGDIWGRPLPFSPSTEKDFMTRAVKTARNRAASSGRAIKGGGLAVTIAKEAIESGTGVEMDFVIPTRADIFFFGEGGPRAIFSIPKKKIVPFRHIWSGFPLLQLGEIKGNRVVLPGIFDISLQELETSWRNE
jgi:phosphoribosylformylglycinamidine synthase